MASRTREIDEEYALRMAVWQFFVDTYGAADIPKSVLNSRQGPNANSDDGLAVYYGGRGIWRDLQRTRPMNEPIGVTVGLLHTGRHYADDLSETGVVYHYPVTRNTGTDAAEVAATKAAADLGLPVFVVIPSPGSTQRRDLRLGWVEAWDDESEEFLVTFGSAPPPGNIDADEPFSLTSGNQRRIETSAVGAPDQHRFRFEVLRRYGPQCALCSIAQKEMLDAAHLRPWNQRGTDDPRNGLVLCANHHRVLDRGLALVNPADLHVVTHPGHDAETLGIEHPSIDHLRATPHPAALRWLWDQAGWT